MNYSARHPWPRREKYIRSCQLAAGGAAAAVLLCGAVVSQLPPVRSGLTHSEPLAITEPELHEAQYTAEAAVELPEDLTLSAAQETGRPGLAGRVTVTLIADGESRTVVTDADTVGELLEEEGVSPDAFDSVNFESSNELTDGMTVRVTRAEAAFELVYEEIPFETVYTEDSTMAEGTEEVTQYGSAGTAYSYYEYITDENGETETVLISSGVQTEPVTEYITYGTRAANTIVTPDGEVLTYTEVRTFEATAYTGGGITATGTSARVGEIAVDPSVIPYGTKVYIVTSDGSIVYGKATAEDCGGAIKGNIVDLYYDTYNECISFGRRSVQIYFLEE